MKIDDYMEYYIQGSDHYLIPKDIFDELFHEVTNWKEECMKLEKQLKIKHNGFMASVDESCDLAEEIQKYKEVIDRLKLIVNDNNVSITRLELGLGIVNEKNDLLDILKEVE